MHAPPTPQPAPAWALGEQAPPAWRRSRAWLAELDGRGRPDRRQDMRNMQILLYDKLRDSLVRFEGGVRGVGVGVGGAGRAAAAYPTYPTLRSWYRQRYQHDAWPAAGLSGLSGISAVQLAPPGISVQVVEAGAAGRGAGARGVGGVGVGGVGAGGGWAAGGWAVGAGLLAALLLLARLTEICGAFKPKLHRSQSASDWQSANNATNGQNGGAAAEGEFPDEAAGPAPGGDPPPPYASCAYAGILTKYTVDLEEPPPPYSACYVTCTIPKDGIPSVHFYNNRNQDLFLHRLQEANTSAYDDTQLDFRLGVGDSTSDDRSAIDNNRNAESIPVSDRGAVNDENDSNTETSVAGSRDDVGIPFVRAEDSNNSLRSHTEVLSRAQLV